MKNYAIATFLLGSAAFAAEISFSGSAEADLRTGFDKDFNPTNYSNHTVEVTTAIGLDEGVSAEVYTAIHSTTVIDSAGNRDYSMVGDPAHAALNGDAESHWANPEFAGFQLVWNFTHNGTFRFGDLDYAAGQASLPRFSKSYYYGTITRDVYLRGLGLDVATGHVMIGAFDSNSKSMLFAADYDWSIKNRTDEKWSVKPVVDLLLGGGGRDRRYTMGAETRYSRSKQNFSYAAYGTAAMLPYGENTTYSLLGEPSLQYQDFSLAFTGYHAWLADKDSAASLQTDMPVQQFLSIEPGFTVHPKVALGLLLEYVDPSVEAEFDEFKSVQPTVYLYPTAGAELTGWIGYAAYHHAPNLWNMGISASVEF